MTARLPEDGESAGADSVRARTVPSSPRGPGALRALGSSPGGDGALRALGRSPGGDLPGLQDALDRAYRYLAVRDRTEHEMRSHLERAGIDGGTVEHAVRVLAELEYLDDARFALRFVHDKRELDHWGAERIERRLAALGVDRDHVRAALADDPGEAELDRALVLLRRRFPEPPGDRRSRDRALGVLLRKGYEPDLAREALASWSRS